MTEISNKQIDMIDNYWIHYTKENGEPGHIQLSACANNFALSQGGAAEGERKCVGYHYEANGFGCYELFNVGHTLVKCALKPNLLRNLTALLRGRKAEELLREEYLDIERTLVESGWMTLEK